MHTARERERERPLDTHALPTADFLSYESCDESPGTKTRGRHGCNLPVHNEKKKSRSTRVFSTLQPVSRVKKNFFFRVHREYKQSSVLPKESLAYFQRHRSKGRVFPKHVKSALNEPENPRLRHGKHNTTRDFPGWNTRLIVRSHFWWFKKKSTRTFNFSQTG